MEAWALGRISIAVGKHEPGMPISAIAFLFELGPLGCVFCTRRSDEAKKFQHGLDIVRFVCT